MMRDLPTPKTNTYRIIKICVLVLVLLAWLTLTATPVF
jgi:hypothetical protein